MKSNIKRFPSVLFISQDFPPRFTGDGKFIAKLSPRLVACGHSVSIICEQDKGAERIDPVDVHVVRLRLVGQNQRFRRLFFVLRVMYLILSGKLSADIIVTNAEPFLVPLLKLMKARGKRWVFRTTLFGSDDGVALSKSTSGKFLLWALREADAIICLTDLFRTSFVQVGLDTKSLVVIPVSVDMDLFKPIDLMQQQIVRNNFSIYGAPVVLFVGGVVYRKGVDLLALAWRNVLDVWPKARLLLVGPLHVNVERHRIFLEEIRATFESYCGLDSVSFIGEVSDPSPYTQICDLFVFPSRQEGFGMAMIEAMACQKPVIAAKFIGYTPFLGNHKQELLIINSDVEELADAMCNVLGDPNLQSSLGNASYRWVKERFSYETVTRMYSELFINLEENNNVFGQD